MSDDLPQGLPSKVYVDTSGLFAALVRNDLMHVRGAAMFRQFLEENVELFTTSYCLLELLALLQARVGMDAAQKVEYDLRPILSVLWVDEELHARAFRRLESIGRADVSLVDCTGFVAMEEAGVNHVFAYDDDFAKQGFTLLNNPEGFGEL